MSSIHRTRSRERTSGRVRMIKRNARTDGATNFFISWNNKQSMIDQTTSGYHSGDS